MEATMGGRNQAQSVEEAERKALRRARIEDLAFHLWQARGCPLGSPEIDWFEAERQLKIDAQNAQSGMEDLATSVEQLNQTIAESRSIREHCRNLTAHIREDLRRRANGLCKDKPKSPDAFSWWPGPDA